MKDLEALQIILEDLSSIEKDSTVPKNVRLRIKAAMDILTSEDKNLNLKIDKSIQQLGDVADDPNLPSYTRMQIWSVVSQLESK